MKYWKLCASALLFGLLREFLGYTEASTSFYVFLDTVWIICIYLFLEEAEKMVKGEEPYDFFKKKRVFLDMDGVLCEFKEALDESDLYKEGYFATLSPQRNIVDAAKILSKEKRIETYVISSVLADSPYALAEKNAWLDRYLPEIDKNHRLFPPCGSPKTLAVPQGISKDDILIDDYGVNVRHWNELGETIKVSRNFFDSIKESMRHKRVISPDSPPLEIVRMVKKIGG